MEEKRRVVRRQADRELLEYIEHKTGSPPSQLFRKRKIRHTIRHTCRATVNPHRGHESGGREGPPTDEWTQRGRLLDLSESGASLFTKFELKLGTEFGLRMKISDGSTIEVQAQVRRSQYKEAKNGYVTGAEFTFVDGNNAERIRAFLKELEATIGL